MGRGTGRAAAMAVCMATLVSTSRGGDEVLLYPLTMQKLFNAARCTNILTYDAYRVCYDARLKAPRTVGYWLDGTLIRDVRYAPYAKWEFYADPNLPEGYRAEPGDWSESGYDYGQMRGYLNTAWDYNLMWQTFDLVNVVPLDPYVMNKLWMEVEQFTRYTAMEMGGASVLDIPVFPQSPYRIGNNGVAIPMGVYRIIYDRSGRNRACLYVKNIKPLDREIGPSEQAYLDRFIDNHLIDCDAIVLDKPPGKYDYFRTGVSTWEKVQTWAKDLWKSIVEYFG